MTVSVTSKRQCCEMLVVWGQKTTKERDCNGFIQHFGYLTSSGNGVILLVSLQSYDDSASVSVPLTSDMQHMPNCCNVCLL